MFIDTWFYRYANGFKSLLAGASELCSPIMRQLPPFTPSIPSCCVKFLLRGKITLQSTYNLRINLQIQRIGTKTASKGVSCWHKRHQITLSLFLRLQNIIENQTPALSTPPLRSITPLRGRQQSVSKSLIWPRKVQIYSMLSPLFTSRFLGKV